LSVIPDPYGEASAQRNQQHCFYLIGNNVRESLSPAIHNALLKKFKLKGTYSLIEIRDDKRFDQEMARVLASRTVLGFNITAPFKEKVIPYLAEIDSIASLIGAVNTVKVDTHKSALRGFNTDVFGIEASLFRLGLCESKWKNRLENAVILGAGGAARACVFTLLSRNCRSLTLINRSMEKSEALVDHFSNQFQRAEFKVLRLKERNVNRAIRDCNLLINAISHPESTFPVKVDFANSNNMNMCFFDLGYKHESTILRAARRAGIRSVDGLLMLSEQARRSFEFWTGVTPSSSFVERIAERARNRKLRRDAVLTRKTR
jgi:shikimate dehydrogenase